MNVMRRTTGLVALLLAATAALAEEGRIPIFEPTVITKSGSYILTRDITNNQAQTGLLAAIVIDDARNVKLDLNGFVLGSDPSVGSVIEADGVRRLVIRNGTLLQTAASTAAVNVTGTTAIDDELVVEGLRVLHEGSGSLRLALRVFDTSIFTIEGNQFINGGIEFQAGTGSQLGSITRNVIRYTSVPVGGCSSINVFGSAGSTVSVVDNTLESISCSSLILDTSVSSVVERNNVAGGSIEIRSSVGAQVVGNTVADASYGILVQDSSGCQISRNITRNTTLDGIAFESSDLNRIKGNVSVDNARYGLYFSDSSTGNTYSDNTSRGNGTGGGGSCSNPGIASCGAPDLCDEGGNNTSSGDNLVPGPPAC